MKKSRYLKFALGIVIGILALVLVLYKVNWKEFTNSLRQVHIGYLFMSCGFLFLNLYFRAKRWQILLRPIGSAKLMSDSFTCYMIGYMANMILPLKAGELIRPYLIGKKLSISKASAFATIVLEHIVDLIIIGLLLVMLIYVSATQIPLRLVEGILIIMGCAVLFLVVLWLFSRNPKTEIRIMFLFSWLPISIRNRLENYIILSISGFRSLHNVKMLLSVLITTFLIWLSTFFNIQIILIAFNIDIPWYAPIFVIVIGNFGMMIPSSPGFIGVAHFLYVFSLSLFNIDKSTALGFAIALHGVGFLMVVGTGIVSLWYEGLSFSQIKNTTD